MRARNSTILPVAFSVRTASLKWPCRAYQVGRPRGQVMSTLALRCCISPAGTVSRRPIDFAQRADVDEEVVHRRFDVEPASPTARELDAEIDAVGRGLVRRVLDLQRLDEADVQLARAPRRRTAAGTARRRGPGGGRFPSAACSTCSACGNRRARAAVGRAVVRSRSSCRPSDASPSTTCRCGRCRPRRPCGCGRRRSHRDSSAEDPRQRARIRRNSISLM